MKSLLRTTMITGSFVAFFLLIQIMSSFRSSAVVVAQSGGVIIKDVAAAAAFCRSLPGGTASERFGYCAFTKAGSEVACVVSSQGSFPDFGEGCSTFTLEEMVNRSEQDIRDDVVRGGGTSTQPTDPGTGSAALNKWLNTIVNLLSGLVGLVIVGSIIVAGIQYTSSGSNASQVSAAKDRITMAILSLVLYIFAFTILQWLIPGGISILN